MNPNTAIAIQGATKLSGKDIGLCLHCGRASHYSMMFKGELQGFCCNGCETVYRFLEKRQLSKYYDLLHSADMTAPSQRLTTVPEQKVDVERCRYLGRANSYALLVPAFQCSACLWLVDHLLKDISGLESHRINLEERTLLVDTAPGESESVLSEVVKRCHEAGYQTYPVATESRDELRRGYSRQQLVHLAIAGAVFANVMLFASSVYLADFFGGNPEFASYFNLWAAGLTLLSLGTAGRSLFVNTFNSLRLGVLHIDAPIVAAATVAVVVSLQHMATGRQGVYFDSVSGLVFFLLLGRYLSDSLTRKARRLTARPTQLSHSGPVDLSIGSTFRVHTGTVLPADGIVRQGTAEVSESLLTGEAGTVIRHVGERVLGGTLNVGSEFLFEVTACGSDIWLARVHQLVDDAASQRSRFEEVTAKIAKWFVGATILLSLLGAVLWWGEGFTRMIEVVCAILIVSCPCALAMAIPLANSLAMRRCRDAGIIIKNADALARARQIDTVVFDKTGTLTTGQMEVVKLNHLRADLASLCGYIHDATRSCLHPVAKSVHQWSSAFPAKKFNLSSNESLSGQGMKLHGTVLHEDLSLKATIFVGAVKWVSNQANSLDVEEFITSEASHQMNEQLCGILVRIEFPSGPQDSCIVLTLKDGLRDGAADLLTRMRGAGLNLRLLTGDRDGPTRKLASSLGFHSAEVVTECTPQQKYDLVDRMGTSGQTVMMVGDGVNDAAVLKRANVGIAVDGGMDLAVQSADVILASGRLDGVWSLIEFSAYHYKSMVIILGLSVFYNAVAVLLAILGFIHPLTAALIMPLASLTVVCIVWIRKGELIWKSSTLSCPLP